MLILADLVEIFVLTFLLHRSNTVNFSRAHVGVWFDPWVSSKDFSWRDSHTEDELMLMVAKISSKFSTVMIRNFGTRELVENRDETDIAGAVAKFNKHSSRHQPQPPPTLELIMTFRLNFVENETSNFDAVKGRADRANSIHSNTVRTLLLVFGRRDLAYILAHLPYYRNMSSKPHSNFTYKLGVFIEEEDCRGEEATSLLAPHLPPILPFLDVVYVYKIPPYENFKEELDSYFEHFTALLDNCRSKLNRAQPNLEVGFISTFYDTTEHGVQSIPMFASYWERIDNWARARNHKVVMQEAFDNPLKSRGLSKTGWWRLVRNSSYTQPSDFVFEDKGEIAARERAAAGIKSQSNKVDVIDQSPQNKDSTGPETKSGLVGVSSSIVLASVGTIGVVLILVGTAVYFVNSKVQRLFRRVGLTDGEIQEFYRGAATTFAGYAATAALSDNGYDRNLELATYSFEIDEQCVLGSGAFGTVFRGRIITNFDTVEVAVKTTKASCPASALKGLLCEIKIIAYIGKHENVVSILGAYTAELKQGKAYVFTELCNLGSLEGYLRKIDRSKLKMLNMGQSGSSSPSSESEEIPGGRSDDDEIEMNELGSCEMKLLHADLERWAYDIASGMEYLAAKHVVHADLATRNVLLTEHKTAKISDFGLSRRLYDYTNYLKSSQEPLPWRWMSPESLRQRVFNEKSDVWAFGITLWEIFSLGDIPYDGMSWSVNWVSMLTQGLKLEKPIYDFADRYSTVLQTCWNVDPAVRPSFSELKTLLQFNSSSGHNNPEGTYMEV